MGSSNQTPESDEERDASETGAPQPPIDRSWHGATVLPIGSAHDVTTGAPRAPNEAFRVATYDVMGLWDMPPCHELTRLLQVACSVFEVPYAVIALYSNYRCARVHAIAK